MNIIRKLIPYFASGVLVSLGYAVGQVAAMRSYTASEARRLAHLVYQSKPGQDHNLTAIMCDTALRKLDDLVARRGGVVSYKVVQVSEGSFGLPVEVDLSVRRGGFASEETLVMDVPGYFDDLFERHTQSHGNMP